MFEKKELSKNNILRAKTIFSFCVIGGLFLSGCGTSAAVSSAAAPTAATESVNNGKNVASMEKNEPESPENSISTEHAQSEVQERIKFDSKTKTDSILQEYPNSEKPEEISGEKSELESPVEADEEVEEVALTPAQACAAAGDFACARRLALEALRNASEVDATEFWSYVDADPLMTHTLDEEVRPNGSNSLSALGGGSTVSLRYEDSSDASMKSAIKPDQDLRQTMYRSEIAYYRLCQILECSFDTPLTRPARWTKEDFYALYSASNSKKNAGYRSKFEHLIWAKENGASYLYVAFKEWIPDFVGFPIEVMSAWTTYTHPNTTYYPELNAFYGKLLESGRKNSRTTVKKLMAYSGGLQTVDILRQLSDLVLIDFLTNNWDRFSGSTDNYGANCHFQPGGIIAIDNGAAFPPWHAPRVVKRLHAVKTFRKALVENLRRLDPDELLSRLIPNPTKEEKKSYERFKERRRDALRYIDALIAEYGEDKVLVY